MLKRLSPSIFLIAVAIAAGFVTVSAQIEPPDDTDRPPFDARSQPKPPNLLRILGLSRAQMQQIRRINQARKPQMDAAMSRLGDANRALDDTIYADSFDEAAFQARLKEVQLAQAEVARLRFTGEANVRRLLTPDQLARFRELRRRFAPPNDQVRPRAINNGDFPPRRTVKAP